MRNLENVLNAVYELIPEDYVMKSDCKQSFSSIVSDSRFTAPEACSTLWLEAQSYMLMYIPRDFTKYPWAKDIWAKWLAVTTDNVKSFC